jgi:hypothetical protein
MTSDTSERGAPSRWAAIRQSPWWHMLIAVLPAYVMSRLCVLVGAAVVASELRVDNNIAIAQGTSGDPHSNLSAGSAVRPIIDVLTSWDGKWYMDLVRDGYPTEVPPDVTYHINEARAAFFPLFPMLGRAVDAVLPFGAVGSVLLLNNVLGLIAVVLIGVLAARMFGERVGRTAAVLAALFPGSFVFSFAYSEALMIALAAGTLLMLHEREWVAAGVLAALTTAARPNGVAVVVACAVAAFLAIRERREWAALVAPALAPLGFIAFQIYVGVHADEPGVWFRVQREAWGEGVSFGWTAVKNTAEAVIHPATSPTDTITAISVAATILLVWLAWRARMSWPIYAYSWTVLALMLTPATVTARPRFLFTAFPLLIGAAKWYVERRELHAAQHDTDPARAGSRHDAGDDQLWSLTMVACGAGLAVLTALYGVFGAIP